ncbi:non-specific lipid transfer protein GPI-anchored 5-like [Panicum virgatum]|uniref:Bifunctional inhibitor/plant lipid transfer protein/seed storage helical domain-containing protein n=1 Tax=Panicum virgatum TaxID=38727 RepID=A0A8T0NDQ2_PANVG|nr:non-specific lipid transfer protein GPI-anchored 5-like [Panicum virgatum]KAG2546988.1 hypothetical protein PVAP13_9KG064700 [Panicum virgatum]
MAWRRLQVLALALAVVVTATTLTSAQQQQPPAAAFPALPSCPPAPLSLSPCIGYVFGVGSATLTACCSQLRGFLRAQAPCLCAASKLAPSPVGLLLGQAQTIIPNICDLPNPCDDDAAAGDGSAPAAASTPSVAGTSPPSSETTTPAATTPATETSSGTPAADPDASSGAPPQPAEDSPATATAPAGAGSKLPQLLHAAGATSSRGTAAGTVFITVFLASAAAMYV